MSRNDSGGERAGRSGSRWEAMVAAALEHSGISYVYQWNSGWLDPFQKVVRVDFYLHPLSIFPLGLIVQVKGQSSQGTADEKIPFLYEAITQHYQKPAVVVAAGKASMRLYDYLKAKPSDSRFVGVYNLDEFVDFCDEISSGAIGRQISKEFNSDQKRLFT